ncbi:HAD-IIA family hydrolase [Paeniglutamicibacter psychrophenolicus]|uniref:HAD-IIA family hydrolase n=1 Tax=Paeniglutamicibacter psychrophenolicus TaxID=257454 RepID=UPI0027800C45|nr:HAD-IIA family hydrolase [Paeniglutamicibacter psychrophenolicus]MDQ0095404.1 HAD superfamily hydrolase (TIGR01450 family) [Paeniglutamicibacter psychrophenolicus]
MLISGFDALLADLDGVVYAGNGAIPKAIEALNRLQEHSVVLAYITNNASRSPGAVAEHLIQLGAPASAEQVFGSADAGAELLAQELPLGSKVLVVGSAYLRDCVSSFGMEIVASHRDLPQGVIQGFDPSLGWKDLAEAAFAIQGGAIWVATNTDRTIPRAEGIAPGNGSLVEAVSAATNVQPLVAGKPEPLLFRRAAETFEATRPLVVGDRLDTDILGGNNAGYNTVLVLTGIDSARSALAARTAERPDYIIADLSGLYADYPVVEVTGFGIRCGAALASVNGDAITVNGDEADLDSWRAACAAWWLAHPHQEHAVEPKLSFSQTVAAKP